MTRSATCSFARKMPALPEHGVDQRGLAVVDVGDDGDVADVRALLGMHLHCTMDAAECRTAADGGKPARVGHNGASRDPRRPHPCDRLLLRLTTCALLLAAGRGAPLTPGARRRGRPSPGRPADAPERSPPSQERTKRVKQSAVITMEKGGEIVHRVLSRGCAEDGGELRDPREEGLLRRRSPSTASSRASSSRAAIPRATAPAAPATPIKAEFNKQKHVRGTVAMARTQHPELGGQPVLHLLRPRQLPRRPVHRLRHRDLGHGGGGQASRSATR